MSLPNSVRVLKIDTIARARLEMERIGVDPGGVALMTPKQFFFNLKLEGVTPPAANILKQEILSIGGEAAVAKGVAACRVDSTGIVLSGTEKQLKRLIKKLKAQPYGLKELAGGIEDALGSATTPAVLKAGGKEFEPGRKCLIMGILNVTPDSFSDGGDFADPARAVARGVEMARSGADIIDVGGESTRPGAGVVSASEELKRILPVVKGLVREGLTVSIDTTKAIVARAALAEGAWMVNDISALSADKDMAGVVKEAGAALVLMHMRGTPATMQDDTAYDDIIGEIYAYLEERTSFAIEAGISREAIIVDPGIGFGKSLEGNLEILRRVKEFASLGRPVMLGTSRKSFIKNALSLGDDVAERLTGQISAVTVAVLGGAGILRVHDIKETKEAALMAGLLR